jgi:hypothetical protein
LTGQDLYFYLNHPIKWVQIAGVVVAIDEYAGRRIYTVDDSSGATIECVVNVPKQNANQAAIRATKAEGNPYGATAKGCKATAVTAETASALEDKPVIDGEVDVGHILLVKGSVKVFRDAKQIQVYKIFHLRCTEDEVRFWKKMTEFHTTVLSSPWVLTDKEVRRCRREATGPTERRDREHKRKKRKAAEVDGTDLNGNRLAGKVTPAPDRRAVTKQRVTGLERRTRRVDKTIRVEGKYSALGI